MSTPPSEAKQAAAATPDLPPDVLQNIAGYLPFTGQASASSVCKTFAPAFSPIVIHVPAPTNPQECGPYPIPECKEMSLSQAFRTADECRGKNRPVVIELDDGLHYAFSQGPKYGEEECEECEEGHIYLPLRVGNQIGVNGEFDNGWQALRGCSLPAPSLPRYVGDKPDGTPLFLHPPRVVAYGNRHGIDMDHLPGTELRRPSDYPEGVPDRRHVLIRTEDFEAQFGQFGGVRKIFIKRVENLSECALAGCVELEEVVIDLRKAKSVPSRLPEYAFSHCHSLSSVSHILPGGEERDGLPFGMERVGCTAFGDCITLAGMTLPASVTDIESSAFECCVSLTRVDTRSGEAPYTLLWGIMLPDILPDVSLSPGVTIARKAFNECFDLINVNINARQIAPRAFRMCEALTTYQAPKELVSIESGAFQLCTNLTDAHVNSYTTVAEGAFDADVTVHA